MRRRALLTTVAAAAAGVAGCADSSPGRTPGSADDPPALDALPCPPSRVADDDAICVHRVENPPVRLVVDDRVAPLSAAGGVTVTLRNESDDSLRFNPNTPDVSRWDGHGWSRLDRRSSGNGVVTVDSGATYQWDLDDLPQFGRLRPGAYLFEIRVPYDGWTHLFAPFRLTDGG